MKKKEEKFFKQFTSPKKGNLPLFVKNMEVMMADADAPLFRYEKSRTMRAQGYLCGNSYAPSKHISRIIKY